MGLKNFTNIIKENMTYEDDRDEGCLNAQNINEKWS